MFVRVRYAGQKVSVQHKKKHSVYKSLETSGEYLRRKDPMHHVVLSSVVDDNLSAQAAGLFPTRVAAVSHQMGVLFFQEQILIRRILPLLQETRRT